MDEVQPVAAVEPVSAPVESAPEPSGPRTTNDIAASVVEEAERPAPVEPPAPVTPVELSAAQKFLLDQGHKRQKDDGRDNWLPVKTIEGMLDRYVDQHRGQWDTRYGAVEKERDTHKADLMEFVEAIRGDPRKFLETLAGQDQRYQPFLTPQEKKELAADANDIEPRLVLDQGAEKYEASLKELRAWDRRQAKREAVAETEALVQPFKQQRALEEASVKDREGARKLMVEAQSWEGFPPLPADGSLSPHHEAVLKVLQEDSAEAQKTGRKMMTFKEAHLTVLSRSHSEQLKALSEDDATRRKRYAEEMNAAPRSTSMSRTGSDAVTSPKGQRTTHDIVREAVAKLEA